MRKLLLSLLLAPSVLHAQSEAILSIRSTALNDTRRIWVRVPSDYAAHQRKFAVTLVLDGQDKRLRDIAASAAGADAVLDFFDPQMPAQIIVGVESKDRASDFEALAADTERFLNDEVIPLLQRQYRLNGLFTVIGHSLAGRFALRLLCGTTAPYGIIAISPALTDAAEATEAARCIAAADSRGEHAIFMATGRRAGDRTEDDFRPNVDSLAALLKRQQLKQTRTERTEFPGYSHSRTTYLGIPLGLAFVFTDSTFEPRDSVKHAILTGKLDPIVEIESFSAQLSRRLNAEIIPPARWYMLAYYLYPATRRADAVHAIRHAVDLYPENTDLREALRKLSKP